MTTMTADRSIFQQLLARVRADAPHRDYFQKAIESAFRVSAKFDAERDRINGDRRLSDEGKRSALAALVEDSFVPDLVQDAGKVARHSAARNVSKRAALGRASFDPTNLVAAMERREVRDFLRGQPDAKRLLVAFELVKDRASAEAMLSGPNMALTGLTPEQTESVHRQYLETFFGGDLAEIDSLAADIEAVAAAVQITRTKLLTASEKSEHEFAQSWQALEQKVDAS